MGTADISRPLAAVLLSTYQGERYLREQLDSILAQKDVRVTLLVRDDGSRDGTLAILREYEARGCLTLLTGPNIGYRHSFMELCKQAPAADYYAFADQDDVWLPEKLSHAIGQLRACGDVPALCAAEFRMTDETLRPIPDAPSAFIVAPAVYRKADPAQRIRTGCVMNDITGFGCTQVWNAALHEIIRSHPLPRVEMDHDTILGMTALLCGEYLPLAQADLLYRQHGQNVSGRQTGISRLLHRLRFHLARLQKKQGPRISECDRELAACYGDCMTELARGILGPALDGRRGLWGTLRFAFSDYADLLPRGLRCRFRLKVLLGYF